MNADKADEILGIKGTEIVMAETEEPNLPAVITDTPRTLEQVDETIDFAKQNMKDAIKTMAEVVSDAAMLAKQTGISDQYSAVSSLFTTFIAANKALVELETKQHNMHKKEEAEAEGQDGPTQINNTINFNGTTEEFLQMLRDIKNGKTITAATPQD
jgi:hypothetical protein